ncbi:MULTISPECIES: DUF3165 family protein [Streptococcus]|jgi:hypothetical protein|uniref:DUF3165 family protein n=2 Tax=Streptococcus sanguinis TaxID=1305 RepID=F3UQS6_STRSA|nr:MULTISPECIES: DUF3165 family protein [Streptococcus]MBF1699104.1 DUF3165 family protein [Streptococcus cristatus]EGJ41780.1 hypothetical protein HMPREF9389_1184 [Streptococcus sanguinis SK355]MBZ2133479.1 DUF3165 family protein [Streptococcus gordonii]MBZ2142016.1 DUF3165 family protein [Streptococcus gordonii]MBZ2144696.1 DUF3165 family protein [Streptococcus gordonii]
MFYLIVGILILLFYIFAAPPSIRGTLNVVTLVLILVVLLILLTLAAFRIFQLPSEIFVSIGVTFLAYFALRDLARMPVKKKEKKNL